jgi:hypothetical protein
MEVPSLQILLAATVFGTARLRTAGTALAKVAPQIEDARAVIGRFGRT